MATLDDEEEPDHRSASPPRRPTTTASRSRAPQYPSRDPPTTPLTNHPQPGVNNSLPYSAKSWNRNVVASFPQTRIHLHNNNNSNRRSARPASPPPPPPPNAFATTPSRPQQPQPNPPQTQNSKSLDDLKAALTRHWGADVRRWLPAALPYPAALMSIHALRRWPPGVVAALARLAARVGRDAERCARALAHVATAVRVRRVMARCMRTGGGEWVAGTDVEYAVARMEEEEEEGDVEMDMGVGDRPAFAAYRGGGLSSLSSLSEPTQELKWVNNNWEGNLDPPRPAAKKRRFDRELGSDEGSVCSDGEVPDGVEFDSFRLRKRNAALKARVAQLKRDVGEACGRADAERMRREDAERFVGATRTLMSEYLGAPKRVDPERFISDTRNSMTLFLAEAKVKKKK
ncbi:hypothetical protein SLS58_004906 [Diplodia intermedia]|uniref:Uncharacterized protein n=1 Tax=Diplodia intermedia TaxID=856260 RepID=A0ABR3TTF7_9PEZI